VAHEESSEEPEIQNKLHYILVYMYNAKGAWGEFWRV
jgi:hypothetical protein